MPDTHTGSNLRTARRAAGLTAEQAAVQLGIVLNTLYRQERGEHHPDLPLLRRYAALYRVPAGWLVDGEGEPPREATP